MIEPGKPVDLYPNQPVGQLGIDAIVRFQKKKYTFLRHIIESRGRELRRQDPDITVYPSIREALAEEQVNGVVIGQVDEVREHQNYKRATVIDPSGVIQISIPKEGCPGHEYLFPGSVLGFVVVRDRRRRTPSNPEVNRLEALLGSLDSGSGFLARGVVYPELPERKNSRTPLGCGVALVADIHVGSYTFIQSNFLEMVEYINNDPTIGYLIIAGDAIDGNGVYPNQRQDLKLKSITEQYEYLGQVLGGIHPRVHLVMAMGNHDGPRREPQCWPQSTKEILLRYNKNITFISNPGYIALGEYRFIVYHGASQDPLIARCPLLSYDRPTSIGQVLLKYRNLCPCTDRIPILPTNHCYHLVDEEVDYLVMGHIHKRGVSNYRGRTCISVATWQHITPFQLKVGFKPDYCILDVITPGAHYLNKYIDFKDYSTDNYVHTALR